MKKLIATIITLYAMIMHGASAHEFDVSDYDATVNVSTGSKLNVRSGPGTSHAIIGARYKGDKVRVTHHDGAWRRIAWSAGQHAYVHGNYLSPGGPVNEDTEPPSLVPGFSAPTDRIKTTSIGVVWQAATDDVGVLGYELFLNGTPVAIMSTEDALPLEFAFSSLSPGTSYSLGIEAFDTAGNRSTRNEQLVSTAGQPVACDGELPFAGTIRTNDRYIVLPGPGDSANVLYADQNPERCNPSRFVVYGGNVVVPIASTGELVQVRGPGSTIGWIDANRIVRYPNIVLPTSSIQARSTLDGLRLLTDLLPNEPIIVEQDGLFFIALKSFRAKAFIVERGRRGLGWETFTQAAIRSSAGGDNHIVINTNFFGCDLNPQDGISDEQGCEGALVAIGLTPGPRDPAEWLPEGLIIEGGGIFGDGRIVAGTSEPNRSYFALLHNEVSLDWLIGEGDPPLSATLAIGGAFSLNIEDSNPGDGLTILGILPEEELVFITVQEDEARAGLQLSDIQIAYALLGIEKAVLWDGGSSSTLVYNGTILAQPRGLVGPGGVELPDVKDSVIPYGVGFRLPGSPCLPDSVNCDPNGS